MIVLASTSPRRRELFETCRIPFRVLPADIDETPISGETPSSMVKRLAVGKARKVAHTERNDWIVAADTTVTVDGRILGKPENAKDAAEMLHCLQGREHDVVGAFAIVSVKHEKEHVEVHTTKVEILPINEREIEEYIATGEPMDKAGSYAAQGYGMQFVRRIEGSYTNVIGLEMASLLLALRKLGAL
jgi:septum formation protein